MLAAGLCFIMKTEVTLSGMKDMPYNRNATPVLVYVDLMSESYMSTLSIQFDRIRNWNFNTCISLMI
jgi:hypothetical protein